jgi:hypothetical protein
MGILVTFIAVWNVFILLFSPNLHVSDISEDTIPLSQNISDFFLDSSIDSSMRTNISAASVFFIGEDASDRSGWSVASAGDVNNDGYADILIGAAYDEWGAQGAGQTYLIYGRSTILWKKSIDLSMADVSFIGENSKDSAGWSVAGAGDVNNDGYDDILIGAPFNDDGGSNAGQTYLIFGQQSPTWGMQMNLSAADASFIGEDGDDWSGYSVAGVGDVNNDDFDDILIGAYADDDGGGGAGQIYLLLGRPTSAWTLRMDLSTANTSFIGENDGDSAGWSVAGAGDVNDDGYDDFVIGALKNDYGGTQAGQAYLILGRATMSWTMRMDLTMANASFVGEAAGDHAGYSVAGVGDVNYDGFDDILIGAVSSDGGGLDSGQAYLILGQNTINWKLRTSLSDVNASFIGEASGDAAGFFVSGVGDINNDSLTDFLIGAVYNSYSGNMAGQVYLMLGRSTSEWTMRTNLFTADALFVGERTEDRLGYSVAGGGDVNDDGVDDILIGAPYNDDGGSDAGKTYTIFGKSGENNCGCPEIPINNSTSSSTHHSTSIESSFNLPTLEFSVSIFNVVLFSIIFLKFRRKIKSQK